LSRAAEKGDAGKGNAKKRKNFSQTPCKTGKDVV
jgi:hypothetical protein